LQIDFARRADLAFHHLAAPEKQQRGNAHDFEVDAYVIAYTTADGALDPLGPGRGYPGPGFSDHNVNLVAFWPPFQ
jgi:hypothetical protein